MTTTLPQAQPPSMDDSSDSSDAAIGSGKTRQRFNNLRIKAKDKVQQLKIRSGHHGVGQLDADAHEALPGLNDNPAFNPDKAQRTLEDQHETFRSSADNTATKIERAVDSIVHPQRSARAKAAREAAEVLNSAPIHQDEVNLIDAEDRLQEARRDATVDDLLQKGDKKDANTEICLQRVMDLEERRDQVKAGFVMSHVNRLRVVNSARYPKPQWQNYMGVETSTGKRTFDWKNYLGHYLLYHYQSFGAHYIDDTGEHPFEADVLRSHLERLAIVSAPWQAWVMDVRSIYRWQDPARTARWLLIYSVLVYSGHVIGAMFAWVIWSTLRNRYIRASTEEMRQSMKRAADNESAALHIGESLGKHGDAWLDQIGRDLGPVAQLYLGDIADLLEIFENFREWKSPRYTVLSLLVIAFSLCICLTSWDFSSRFLYSCMGVMFFVCWPISSLNPQYRRTTSWIQHLFFNVPTNAQWAFGYLRRQALLGQLVVRDHEQSKGEDTDEVAIQRETAGEAANVTNVPSSQSERGGGGDDDVADFLEELGSTPLVSFHADCEGKHGRLVITACEIHFQHSIPDRLAWTIPFNRLDELRKLDSGSKLKSKLRALTKDKAVSSGNRLVLQEVNGVERLVEVPRDRDECFNCIVGFSGLQWQLLQGGAVELSKTRDV